VEIRELEGKNKEETSMMARWLMVGLLVAVPCVSNAQNAPRPDADPQIEKIVASISEDRLKELLTKLVSFGTRNTLSDQESPTRGIGAARNWILEEMRRSSEKLRVNFDTHIIPPQGRITKQVDLRNVIAILPGRSPRRIYISGHYDSVNIGGQNQSNSAAPAPTPAAIDRPVRSSIRMSRPTAPTTTAAARC
jgi:hypothetical protein